MYTSFKPHNILFIIVLIVSAALFSAQVVLGAPLPESATPPPAERPIPPHPVTASNARLEPNAANTLTLAIPNMPLELGMSMTLDLLNYTHYDGVSNTLVYTAELAEYVSPYNFEFVTGTHFITMTAKATISKTVKINIGVSDGNLAAHDGFDLWMNTRPEINLPGSPLVVLAGKRITLTTQLEAYAQDEEDDTDVTFSIISPTTGSKLYQDLAPSIYTATTAPHYRYLTFQPKSDVEGKFRCVMQVQDKTGLTATDTVTLSVVQSDATTLTLKIPDMPLVLGMSMTLDLFKYTVYDGVSNTLVYTAQTINNVSTYHLVMVTGTHFITLTSNGSFSKTATIEIGVSDGILTYFERFDLWMNARPQINLPETPLVVLAGNPVSLTTQLENYIYDQEDEIEYLVRSIISPTPGSALYQTLAPSIYTSPVNSQYHYLAFQPQAGTLGTFQCVMQIQDRTGLTATDAITLSVLQGVYLPIVGYNTPLVPILRKIENPDGDGIYDVVWDIPGSGYVSYELEYATQSNFSDAKRATASSSTYGAYTMAPGTYYWRVRVWVASGEEPNPWSNVRKVTVGSFAYLYVDPLCGFDTKIELTGAGNYSGNFSKGDDCTHLHWWRSVPAGTYSTRITWVGGSLVRDIGPTPLGNKEYQVDASNLSPVWVER